MNRQSKPITDDLISFTRHLAGSFRMKLPLVSALEAFEKESMTKPFYRVVQDITTKVEQGMRLSKALDAHSDEFPEYYRKMVAAGEEGNSLPELMDQLSSQVENQYKLNKRIRAALAYPCLVGVLIVLDLFLAGFIGIFPRYQAMFEEFGVTVPLITSVLIVIGNKFFFVLGTLFLIAGLLIALFFYTGIMRSGPGKMSLDKLILNLPLFGIISRKIAAVRFTRVLGSLLKGGVPMPDALRLAAATTDNEVIKQAVMTVREQVMEGESMGMKLEGTTVFPPTMVWMIAQGEYRGELIPTLEHLADFYDTQVDTSIRVATALFEPMVIIFLGIIVAFFVAGLFLPLFQIINIFH